MVTREEANARSREITHILNEKIDKANQNPKLQHRSGISPIRRTHHDGPWIANQCTNRSESPSWGDHELYEYGWVASFEWGSSASSDGFYIRYYSNPMRYSEKDDSERDKWLKINPHADLSKELYGLLFCRVPDVISNDFNDVLSGLDKLLEMIAQSRKAE